MLRGNRSHWSLHPDTAWPQPYQYARSETLKSFQPWQFVLTKPSVTCLWHSCTFQSHDPFHVTNLHSPFVWKEGRHALTKDFKQAEKTGYILFQIFTSLLVKINMSPVKVLYVKSCKGPELSRYKSVTVNDTSDKLSPPLFACGFVSLCVLAGCHTETTGSHNYCLH